MHPTQTPSGLPSKSLNVSSVSLPSWETFEKNIEALKKFHAYCFEAIEKTIEEFRQNPETDGFTTILPVKTPNGELNLLYARKEPRSYHLIHGEFPSDEATEALVKAKLDYPQIVFFLGLGLGYSLRKFMDQRPTTNSAVGILEPDPYVFLRSLQFFDYTKILEQDGVYLIVGKNENFGRTMIGNIYNRHVLVSTFVKMVSLDRSIQLHSDYYKELVEVAMSFRDVAVFSGGNSIEDSHIGAKNIADNLEECIRNPGFGALKNLLEGKTVVSVASGPSTDEHWDHIKSIYGKIPIIVCDSSLQIMLKKGIIPDFVTAVERCPVVTGFFRDLPIPERTVLVGPALLLKETLDAYQGKKILYAPTSNIASAIGTDFLEIFFPGSSAGNLNIALAGHLGAKNVIMIGHNLAYDPIKKVSHLKGTYLVSQETPMSDEALKKVAFFRDFESQDGTCRVKTSPFWFQFKEQLENLISNNPQMNFINVAAKGAKIAGAKFMSFEEAFEKFGHLESDAFKAFQEKIKDPTLEIVQERADKITERCEEILGLFDHYIPRISKILEKLATWRTEIEEKEAKGRNVSLHYLDDAIDDVLKLKVEMVNEDRKFYSAFIQVLTAAHFAFERELNAMPGKYQDNYSLKKDFLLKHEQYFKIYDLWMPKIRTLYESSLNKMKNFSFES